MTRAQIKVDEYRSFFQDCGVADQRLARTYFTGKEDRHSRTEKIVPRLKKRRELIGFAREAGNEALIVPRLFKSDKIITLIDHHLGAAECYVRFHRADPLGTHIAQSEFHGMGSIPDQAIMYATSMLLIEYHTYDNFRRHMVEQKVSAYDKHLSDIESYFKRGAVVLFVIDAPRDEIQELNVSGESYMFVDWKTFKSVPIGQQLTAPIYIWGGDGKPYPLRNVQPGEHSQDL